MPGLERVHLVPMPTRFDRFWGPSAPLRSTYLMSVRTEQLIVAMQMDRSHRWRLQHSIRAPAEHTPALPCPALNKQQ